MGAARVERRLAAIPPADRIEFRIGINVGDIAVEDGDIFGDGVNVAARLEGLAEPGGICVSARVQEDAAGRLDLSFDDMGEQALKNIARPVRAFRVRAPGAAPAASISRPAAPALALPDKPSIAVLPFKNMSGDAEQEFFADGIAEDVITALSRYPSLFVIARNSSFSFKGRAVDVKQVGREDAWGAYQRGLWHLGKASSEDDERAKTFFQRAVDLDPMFAGGYIGLAAVLARAKGTQSEEEAMARRAVALDGGDAEAHARLALALNARGDHRGALAQAEEALTLCPNLAAAHGARGVILAYAGRAADGLAALETCIRLDPRAPFLVNRLNQVTLAHYFCRDYEAAVAAAQRTIRAFPDFPAPYRWLAAALGELGRTAEAKEALDKAIAISPASFDFQVRQRPLWFRPDDHAHMLDGLKKAGWHG